MGKTRFGFDVSGLGELLYWADIIDGARFESATAAVEMEAAAMKVAMVIENATEPDYIPRIIPLLTTMPMSEILRQPFVHEKVTPLLVQHVEAVELIRKRAELKDGVIYFDLTEDGEVEGLNKFIPYYLYPKATYTIGLSRSKSRTKISVGTNPWTTLKGDELVNLAQVCERFGGGGHARVGAISYRVDELALGREVAEGIVRDLRAVYRPER